MHHPHWSRSRAAVTLLGALPVLFAASCGAGSSNNQTTSSTPGTGAAGGSGGGGGSGASTTSGTSTWSSGSTTTSSGSTSTGTGTGTDTGTGGGPPVCPVGTVECDGNIAQVCDGNGGYETVLDCAGSGQVCSALLGGCVTCQPGTGSCNGNVGTYCRNDGTGTEQEVCDPLQGTTCNPATGHCTGVCSASSLHRSYIGCDYFPTVTANLVDSSIFHFAVAVSNTTANPADITVTQGANTVATATVAANSVQVIPLPWIDALKGPSSLFVQPFPASVLQPQGAYRLRSNQPVTVYQFNPLEYTDGAGSFSYSNDASLLLPTNAWTSTYRVAARHHFVGVSGFYAVTAIEDGTVVNVTAGPQSGMIKGGVPGVAGNGTGQFTLNAGDVAELVTAGYDDSSQSDPNDPTGTLVQANKPVQVIAGHQCIYIPDGTGYCDHIEESMLPFETLSNEYIVTAPLIPTGGATPKVEMVRIIATADNTTLTYDPPQPGAPSSIGQAGGWIELANTAADFSVVGSAPILVVQYMEGQDAGGNSGDPAMATVIAKSQYRKSYLFHAPTNYETSYVNIIAATGATVTLDGQPVTSFTPIGGTGFGVARLPLSNAGDGNHSASSTAGFGISVYGYGQYTSYWYPGGSDLTVLHD